MRAMDYVARYVDDLRSGKRCRHRHAVPVAVGTLRSYETLEGVLRRFENEVEKQYELDEIGMEFQRRFVGWCMAKGLKNNTIRHYLTLVRIVMNSAVREHVCMNKEFKMVEFLPMEECGEMMVMTHEMMRRLMLSNFESKRLNEARDIFAVGYLTGQRFSDYSRMCVDMYEMIEGQRFIRIVQQKTGNEVYIPLDNRVDEILKRYEGRLPRFGLAEFNMRLHEISAAMGLEGRLTSHTARRSFATNAYCAGIPMSSIMCITGHTREEHLRRYLHVTADVMALQAAKDLYG